MIDLPTSMTALAGASMLITGVAMSIRIYVRTRIIKAWGRDDWVMLVALACFESSLVCSILGMKYGTGRHIWELEQHRAQEGLKFWFLCEALYAPATILLKVSVGLFFLRITTHKLHIRGIYFFITGSLLGGVVYILLIVFQCNPVSFWWNLDPNATGKCITPHAFTMCTYFISALNSAADIFFALMPLHLVWRTTMNTKTRFVVYVLLSIASIACIVTIVRLPYLRALNVYKHDFLFTTAPVAICSIVEVALGITAACAATFRPLFQSWLDNSPSRIQGNMELKTLHASTVADDSTDLSSRGESKGVVQINMIHLHDGETECSEKV